MQKQKISASQHLTYDDAVSYLEALLAGFRERKIVVENGMEHVVLTPPDNVSIEIEAKVKKEKQKFSLELSWTDAPEAKAPQLKISSDEPDTIQITTPDSAEEMPASCDATAAKGDPETSKPDTAQKDEPASTAKGDTPAKDDKKEKSEDKTNAPAKDEKESGKKSDEKSSDKPQNKSSK